MRCRMLSDLSIGHPYHTRIRQTNLKGYRSRFWITPHPRNMHPEHHLTRMMIARARAMNLSQNNLNGAFFVDAAGLMKGIWAVLGNSPRTGSQWITCQMKRIAEIEEVAIVLAAPHPTSEFIITDSRIAYSNYMRGKIVLLTFRIL